MPRVPRPEEMPRAALDPAHQPAQINMRVAESIGQSGRAMGNAIAAIGNAFGEVAGKIGQANDATNYDNARLEWLKGDQTIQDETRQQAGEDGIAWQGVPQRYADLNKSIDERFPISNPAQKRQLDFWREQNTFNRGIGAAREYQGAQRNQFLRGFDQDVSGLEERIGAGEVDPTMFGQHYDALTGKLGSMSRTVLSQAEIEAKTRELQSRLVGATDRYLAAKDPAERERFWGQVRGGRFEIDQNTQGGPQGGPGITPATGNGPDYRGQNGPAAIRYNNPGAQWPGQSARKFGAVDSVTLNDGQGNKIAVFPTAVHGAAAQFDLLERRYTGKTLASAITTWSGGNSSSAYAAKVAAETGLTPGTVLTKDMIHDPRIAIPIARSMASMEAGRKEYPLTIEQWAQAHQMAFGGGGIGAAAKPEGQSAQVPPPSQQAIQVADAGNSAPANDNAGQVASDAVAQEQPASDNDPAGSYPTAGNDPGDNDPGGRAYAAPGTASAPVGGSPIPMGRLAPGQVFTVNTPRGPLEVRSEWINALPQRAREQMSRQAGEQYRLFERGRQSVAKGMIEDGEVNVALHGRPSETYDAATVRAAFAKDPETLRKHGQRMAIAKAVYDETSNFANMPSDDIVNRMSELEQKYLAEGSSDASTKKIMDLVVKKTDALLKQREADPAGSVEGSQEVRSVREKLIKGEPRNKLDAIALIQARLMAQTRLDIPEQAQSPLTRRELLTIAPSLRGLEPGTAAESIEKTYGMIRERYGEKYAPMILRKAIDTTVKQRALHDSYAAMLTDIVERENTMGPPVPPGFKPPPKPGVVDRLYQMLPSMPSPRAIGDAIGLGSKSTPAGEAAPVYPKPNDAAINALKKNPTRAADFDAQFGPGSAEKAIPGINRLIKLEQLK